MIRKFISYYKPHWKLFSIDMFCSLLVAICDLFYPIIAKNIINDYVPNQNIRLLVVWSIALVIIYVLKAILNYIIQYWGHIVGVRLQADMRQDLFNKLQRLPFSYFDSTKTGTVMSRLVNDLMEVSELAHHGPENVFISGIMLIGSFIMLANINLQLTIIVFLVVPLIVIFASLMRNNMTRTFKKTREKVAEVNANVAASIAGIRVTRAYTCNTHEIQKFKKVNADYQVARAESYKVMGQFHSGMNLMMDILYVIVLCAGGVFFFNGKIDVGEFTMFLLYINNFLKPIRNLIAIYEQIQNGMTGFSRFIDIINTPVEIENPNAVEIENFKEEISFNNISFKYTEDSDSLVLEKLSFNIKKGSTVALVGPSGGGKTTICHLLPRFYELTEGSITIDGIDIKDLSRYSLRKNIGIVQQDVFLFAGTIRENIAYGKIDATDEEILDAAEKANILEFIKSMPEGLDTYVGERGVKLSGGQKQRISIARAFLKNPPVLILDEATSALDNVTEMQIQHALDELSKGRTTLVVAHRLSTVKNADNIIVIDKTGIIEEGNHNELIEKNGVYANLYQYQFKN